MSLLEKIQRYGILGSGRKALTLLKQFLDHIYWRWAFRSAPVFENPTSEELELIERDLVALGVTIYNYTPPPMSLWNFKHKTGFRKTIMAA